MDHGYQPQLSGEAAPLKKLNKNGADGEKNTPSTPELDVYYPDCRNAWDLERFPSGAKGFVKACVDRGLRPAIWWSPRVARNGIIHRERPEWLLRDRNGEIIDIGNLCLDASVPSVRSFLEKCVDTITFEWGFQGIKLDFFSWMFDHPDACFSVADTGVNLKRWFFSMIRSKLGPNGYFLHCISCPMGDPFLAIDGCDAFRSGIDIHSGEWNYHVKASSWLLPAMLNTGKGTWFGNIDSCMGKSEIPRSERCSRLAFAYMTSGMLEFSGPIEELESDAIDDYRRIAERCDQGRGFQCLDEQAFFGKPLPTILLRDHVRDSLTRNKFGVEKTVGFFNWGETEIVIGATFGRLGIDQATCSVTDFWSNETVAHDGKSIHVVLAPRQHALLDIQCR